MNIPFVPLPPFPHPAAQPGLPFQPQDMFQFIDDNLPIMIAVLLPPLFLRLGYDLLKTLADAVHHTFKVEADEKSKREQSVSFFDPPDTERDYVVGFGNDGEMIYASEKPKRKNDEVVK